MAETSIPWFFWSPFARVQQGTVTASLMLRKLGSYPRQNGLAVALRELGRIGRTLFTLDWLQSVELRRRVREPCASRNRETCAESDGPAGRVEWCDGHRPAERLFDPIDVACAEMLSRHLRGHHRAPSVVNPPPHDYKGLPLLNKDIVE